MEDAAASHVKAFQPNKKPRWGNGASEYNFCSTTGVVKVIPRLSRGYRKGYPMKTLIKIVAVVILLVLALPAW